MGKEVVPVRKYIAWGNPNLIGEFYDTLYERGTD